MNVSDHPYIRYGLKIDLGTMSRELVFEVVPVEVRERLSGLLQQADRDPPDPSPSPDPAIPEFHRTI